MRSPNPSSFKNFSTFKKKSAWRWRVFISLFLLGILGGAGFVVWSNQACKPRPQEKKIVLPPQVVPTEPKIDESYVEFDKSNPEAIVEVQDIEEEDPSSTASDTPLVRIFQEQEYRQLPAFSDDALWQKNAQKPVKIRKKGHLVVLAIEVGPSFSMAEINKLHKLGIPALLIFSEAHSKNTLMAEKAWQKGHEIAIKSKFLKNISLEQKFPKMIGVIEENSFSSYLILSKSKGLKNGMPHDVFSFPIGKADQSFQKSKRSLVWINASRPIFVKLEKWIQQQKKKVIFVPLSQLYDCSRDKKKKAAVINLRKIKAVRPYLA